MADVFAEVDTEKAVVEIESMFSGVIERLLLSPGDKVPVGAVMAVVRAEGPEEAAAAAPAVAPPAAAQRLAGPRPTIAPAAAAGRPRASPVAQKLAEEKGIDLSTVAGTGPGGRV